MIFIDTHTHLDGEEYAADRDEVVARAKAAGVAMVFIPAISTDNIPAVLDTCRRYPGFAKPMIGIHPEEVRADYEQQIAKAKTMMTPEVIDIGEVGLDFYWSREYEQEQLKAFEMQVQWAVEAHLPLMIHCRKAQQEMVAILKRYEADLVGGVFHCFTGNEQEAAQLLRFNRFALGIGGVLTFKKSKLPDVVKDIPLSRIVLETDSPYMAPVPKRGERNESAYVEHVLHKMALCHGKSADEVAHITTHTALSIFTKAADTMSNPCMSNQ